MGTLNPNIPLPELSRLMTTAGGRMGDYGLELLTAPLLLQVFLDERESVAHQILLKLADQRGYDWDDLARRVEMMARHNPGRDAKFNFTDDFGKDIPLTDEMLVVLDEALTIAKAREETKAGSGHALAAMAQQNVTTFGVLSRMGVTPAAILALLGEITQDGAPMIRDFIHEAKDGQAFPVYQRHELLREAMNLLALSHRRHMIFVGSEGAGKRTLGYSLAQLLATDDSPLPLRSFVQVNEGAFLEDPLATMRVALRRASGGVLFVPDIERFFDSRPRSAVREQVNRELHKALLGEEQVVIGTATPAAHGNLRNVSLIRQNTHALEVPPATVPETVAMLGHHRHRLEQEYEIEITPAALETAADLADRYVKEVALPAAATRLTERACALVSLVHKNHNLTLPDVASDGRLDSDDVLVATNRMTKIPVARLNREEQHRYANMVEHLQKRIIGQYEAILAVSRAIKTARVGLREAKRPVGSFLFLGPSGVGKTELAKTLAEFLFGSEDDMLTLDMSEYQEEASVNRLIGAPPGYVGFEGGGQLTDFVRGKPYTVVLFDEVEKANRKVLDVLLQVMDEGRLTDSQGREVSLSEAVIVMTSNKGAEHMLVPLIGERERALVMSEVHSFFRPEFLNRLDEIILFHQLTPEQLAEILDLMLKREEKLARRQNIELVVNPDARKWLLAQNHQPHFGARPLRRIIARHLREPLADYLLRQAVRQNTRVSVHADLTALKFEITALGKSPNEIL
jgi:ATP-dependent Clp protease ATP-binding subunit ClpC